MKLKTVCALLGVLAGNLPLVGDVIYSTDFPEATDTLPTDWTVRSGATGNPGWRIDTGGDFRFDGGGNSVAEYTGPLSGGFDAANLSDFQVELTFRKSTSNLAGITARSDFSSGDFYHVRLSGQTSLQIYKFDNSVATLLGTTASTSPETYDSGETWRLRVTFEGTEIDARIFDQNEVEVASVTVNDSTFTSGFTGLRASTPVAYETYVLSSLNTVPEPGTAALLLLGLGWIVRRRRSVA